MSPNQKFKVVVRRVLSEDGPEVQIERECESTDDVKTAIEAMTVLLPPSHFAMAAQASMSTARQVQVPRQDLLPNVTTETSQTPTLSKAPYTYKPSEAVVEVLDPRKSIWAQTPRTVKEVQDMLMSLNVTGVSNLANFDSVVRTLVSSGKLKRERIDGVYKYFSRPSE